MPVRRSTALVTGASGGIGLELARLLVRDDYDVVLVARSELALHELASDFASRGVRATVIATDLAEPDGPQQVVDRLGDRASEIDVLVNNAGVGGFGPFAETDLTSELRMLQLNVVSLTALTKLLLPGMLARGSGRILNVGSTAGMLPGPLMAVYYASKAYVNSFSQALAEEVRGSGVTVTVLCPGPVRTGFQEAANLLSSRLTRIPMMEPQVVAEAAYQSLLAGRPLVVPGWSNRAMVQALRLSPRRLTLRLTRQLQERR